MEAGIGASPAAEKMIAPKGSLRGGARLGTWRARVAAALPG
jgi:hypothetical protein